MSHPPERINICVVLAFPTEHLLIELTLPAGTTANAALRQSGVGERYPDLLQHAPSLGIYGKIIDDPDTYVMANGDRLEVYRPLLLDPKEARRQRADKARTRKKI